MTDVSTDNSLRSNKTLVGAIRLNENRPIVEGKYGLEA